MKNLISPVKDPSLKQDVYKRQALTSGSLKQLKGKEARVIKYIVKLVKEQGFSDFFILVDEFEDITEGRLTKSQIDNYVYNRCV